MKPSPKPAGGRPPGKGGPTRAISLRLPSDVLAWLDGQPKGTRTQTIVAACRAKMPKL